MEIWQKIAHLNGNYNAQKPNNETRNYEQRDDSLMDCGTISTMLGEHYEAKVLVRPMVRPPFVTITSKLAQTAEI